MEVTMMITIVKMSLNFNFQVHQFNKSWQISWPKPGQYSKKIKLKKIIFFDLHWKFAKTLKNESYATRVFLDFEKEFCHS